MSGIMVKTALFMLFRFFFDFFQGARVEWGVAFLIIGSVSAILGILYANTERDLKRLLAYSTVENVGIITIAFGAGLTLFALGQERVALFALAAALYHLVNHAIFKSLLFFGAGAVVSATGTRNIEAYGGLMRVMPYTAAFFLAGSLAIAALPPFNGFVSEWLTFQVLFAGVIGVPLAVKIAFLIALSSLVFTSGLAVACFVKVFGTAFLARPRTDESKNAKEVAWPMLLPMGILSVLSLVLGLTSSHVLAALTGVVASIGLTNPATLRFPFLEIIASRHAFADVLPLMTVAALLTLVVGLLFVAISFITRKQKVIIGPTWDCGFPLSSRGEITATSFSRSLVTIFQGVLRPTKQSTVEYHDERTRYFVRTIGIKTGLRDVYRERLYVPIDRAITFLADRVRRVQTGNVNAYILYFSLALIGALLFAARS
jgi:hydrogenase-4 component B